MCRPRPSRPSAEWRGWATSSWRPKGARASGLAGKTYPPLDRRKSGGLRGPPTLALVALRFRLAPGPRPPCGGRCGRGPRPSARTALGARGERWSANQTVNKQKPEGFSTEPYKGCNLGGRVGLPCSRRPIRVSRGRRSQANPKLKAERRTASARPQQPHWCWRRASPAWRPELRSSATSAVWSCSSRCQRQLALE